MIEKRLYKTAVTARHSTVGHWKTGEGSDFRGGRVTHTACGLDLTTSGGEVDTITCKRCLKEASK